MAGVPQGRDGAVKLRPVRSKFYKDRVSVTRQLPRHLHRLVEAYIRGKSKEECMLAAGYAESTARKQAWRVFGREDVQRAIDERMWKIRNRDNGMIDRIKDELANIAFFNIGTVLEVTPEGEFVFNFEDATMEDFAAIGEVTVEEYKDGKGREARSVKRVKVKPYDKKAALDSLSRIYGMFHDNLNVTAGEDSLEERLAKGRARVAQAGKTVVDAEFEEVED